MITPRFRLSQTTNTLTIKIRAPHCNLKELETLLDDNVFLFVCAPYYLRLQLPGTLVEESYKSSFDADTGEFAFTYDKQNPGEEFEDLDLITKFLCPRVSVNEGGRKIELIGSESAEKGGSDVLYGFAMRGNYEFGRVSEEFRHVFDVNPIEADLAERKRLRMRDEAEKFSVDHYVCDLIEDEEIRELLALKSPYKNENFTDAELDFLKDLPNVAYNLSDEQVSYCHNGLVDLLFAYCYDRRTTYFEGTCESGWTISKVSATLCWFDGFASPKEAAVCAFRRSLIYPLYRNFRLSERVFEDVKEVLRLGERFIVKCLIDVYNVFLASERYVLNNIFVRDYVTYVMKWDKKLWLKTVDEVSKIVVNVNDLGLNLRCVEQSIQSGGDISYDLSKLNISEVEGTDSDDSD